VNPQADNRITEQASAYTSLDTLSIHDLLTVINTEDHTVPQAVALCIPAIEAFVTVTERQLAAGRRLFYIGSGTSGRLGIVDASELPPTYGVPHDVVVGIIAGGDGAIRKAVEFAEDDPNQGWKDLTAQGATAGDVVLGLSASGTTPYVLEALQMAKANGLITGSITCNPHSAISKAVAYPIEAIVGPEVITGSTRMKAGTAQKLILNMISTALMVRLGHVIGNKMVDMQLTNHKLIDRGTRMVQNETGIPYQDAHKYLLEAGSVRAAIANIQKNTKNTKKT
jgi:N-acetylmuramic acid 6-phosphate etherase